MGPMKTFSSCGSPETSVGSSRPAGRAGTVVDIVVDQDALHADAGLARLVEGPEDDPVVRVVQIGVAVDDHRGVAAELQHHLLLDRTSPSAPSPLRASP
jgi:hypothetical protein